MLVPGGDNIGGLGWDNSSVGVSNESSVWESGDIRKSSGVGESSGWVNDSSGSSKLSLGSSDLSSVDRNNSAIGVGNQSSVSISIGISSSIWVSSDVWISGIGQDWVDNTSGSCELSLGSSDGRLVSRDHSTVGVGHQLGGGHGGTGSKNLRTEMYNVNDRSNIQKACLFGSLKRFSH